MTTCNNCKFSKEAPNYKDKYYCAKLIHEKQNTYNPSDFGCTRGVKK